MLEPRHIQNFSDGATSEPHWGYADRIVPCKNDAGSCQYLDAVYLAHDLGMLYMGVLWATIFSVLFIWALWRRARRPAVQNILESPRPNKGATVKLTGTIATAARRFLLPDASNLLFGRTTRFQVALLALLAGYLFVLSFLGITYATWVTPVKNMPGVFSTRVGLGPWADRVGVIAYALTPLSIMLSSRESLLSVLTGVPYQSFNFLHRWLGYIIVMQAILHASGWLVIELHLYQPQPKVGREWIVQPYMIWGLVAMALLLILFALSTPWGIRLTGYEFFRKAHYVLAMVYIGACWAHWNRLECFLVPAFILWGVDRGARLIRTALLHYHPTSSTLAGFSPATATITRFADSEHGDVLRLDLTNEQDIWKVGQHFYLCFTESSVWQSHPFTPLNAPVVEHGSVKHSYVLRAKSGETRKLAELVQRKKARSAEAQRMTTSVLLTGGYGENLLERIDQGTNIVCVAGGTGITYVLPLLLHLARDRLRSDRRIHLIWAMRHSRNIEWVDDEMAALMRRAQEGLNLSISLFATRDVGDTTGNWIGKCDFGGAAADETSSSPGGIRPCHVDAARGTEKMADISTCDGRRPNLVKLVGTFVESTVSGRTVVFASGPGGMISDLRSTVADLNVPSKVWRRQERFDVELVCDDRLEW